MDVATQRALKELARLAILAFIGNVLIALKAGGKINWQTVALSGGIAAYRAASTYVHDNPSIPFAGLFPF